MKRNQERQNKIKELFERELKNNPEKIKEYSLNSDSKDNVRLQQFLFPRILIQKYVFNTTVDYSMHETNTDIYYPLEEKYIDLCLEYGVESFSRTLRIYRKKRALKKLAKQKIKPEDYEDKIQYLNEIISNIYKSGNTINLNLLR